MNKFIIITHTKTMADPSFSWIYLIIFLAIPLARIIPRIIAKRRQGTENYQVQEQRYQERDDDFRLKPSIEQTKPKSKDMQVLGTLHQGANTFEKIQRATNMDGKELDSILEDLEKRALLKVVKKQGMFGPKVELYSTDKGFKEYYS